MLTCTILDVAKNCTKKLDLRKYPVTTVEQFYCWDEILVKTGGTRDKFQLTPKQAIKINLGEITARNEFYFANIQFLRGYVRKRVVERTKYNDFKAEEFDDIMQQIYLDLPYYNFTSRQTFFKSLRATIRLAAYGGLINLREYQRAVKITQTISLYHECRYQKSEDEFYLLDVVADNMPSPEDLAIRAEERANEKEDENYYKFEKLLKNDIILHAPIRKKAKERLFAAIM